jgi:hypothetical protein
VIPSSGILSNFPIRAYQINFLSECGKHGPRPGLGTYVTGWEYDLTGRMTAMIYPGDDQGGSGERVEFDYTPQGTVLSVIGDSSYASGMLTDEAGRLTQLVRGNVTTSYAYYAWDEAVNTIGQGAA